MLQVTAFLICLTAVSGGLVQSRPVLEPLWVGGGYAVEWRVEHPSNQLQVRKYGGDWGSVCDDSFDDNTAEAVCRFLGQDGEPLDIKWNTAIRTINDIDIHLDGFSCPADATDFSQCTSNAWGVNDCSHSEDVVLECHVQRYDWRLGPSNQLQVKKSGQASSEWGSVCDDSFDDNTAEAVCRFLGHVGEPVTTKWNRAGKTISNIDIALDQLSCPVGTTDFSQCTANAWGVNDCSHSEDVLLECHAPLEWQVDYATDQLQVRKAGQASSEWGSVCDDSFDDNTAEAVCRWLGHVDETLYVQWARADRALNNIDINLDDFSCPSSATDFYECTANPWGDHNCQHSEDILLKCHGVSAGAPEYEWRVDSFTHQLQVRRNYGDWGSVCDDLFDFTTATVVCKFMGHQGAINWDRARRTLNYKDIHLDGFSCPAGATDFSQCTANVWGDHDCQHSEDVLLTCYDQ